MKKRKDTIIAEGEATGHMHTVVGDDVEVYGDGDDRELHAPQGGVASHQEHAEIAIPPGEYNTGIVREMDHYQEQARRVAD